VCPVARALPEKILNAKRPLAPILPV